MQHDLLHAETINNQLSIAARAAFPKIIIFPTIDSTNNYLLDLPTLEQQSGYICLAEQQTAGRGRQGKQWVSPPMQNIYLSLLWKISNVNNMGGLSLVVGFAIINALQKLGIEQAQIKWPNDILVNGKKLAGILLETTNTEYMVIGIGLNVHMSATTQIDQPWISIEQLIKEKIDRNQLVAHILNSLLIELNEFNLHGLKSLYTDWHLVDALYQKNITIKQGTQILQGTAQGINHEGALLIAQQNKITAIYSGEIVKSSLS